MDNKERILACALDLFYTKGYDAAGVREIAETAGITKPTLYYYFGSKRGLLEQVLSVNYSELQMKIDKAAQRKETISETLFEIARAFFDFGYQNRKFYLLMLALFYSGRENEGFQVVYPLVQQHYQKIVRVFKEAADQLGNMNGRQRQFAIGFMGVLDHHLMLMNQNFEDEEIVVISDEETRNIVHQFMYGIFS